MEYDIVSGLGADGLVKKVNELMKKGWRTEGGPFVHNPGNGAFLYQAMVKIEIGEARPGGQKRKRKS